MKGLGPFWICVCIALFAVLVVPVAAADVRMPNVSGWTVGPEASLTSCPSVLVRKLAKPENEAKPYWDANVWYLKPNLDAPFIVVLLDPDTGLATEFFIDYNRDGVADKYARTLEGLGLSSGDVCEIAKEVE